MQSVSIIRGFLLKRKLIHSLNRVSIFVIQKLEEDKINLMLSERQVRLINDDETVKRDFFTTSCNAMPGIHDTLHDDSL